MDGWKYSPSTGVTFGYFSGTRPSSFVGFLLSKFSPYRQLDLISEPDGDQHQPPSNGPSFSTTLFLRHALDHVEKAFAIWKEYEMMVPSRSSSFNAQDALRRIPSAVGQ